VEDDRLAPDQARGVVGRVPRRLVYHEAHTGRSSALRREGAIKAMSRRQKESLVRLTG
jgi:predicted GIY-YIG superfamily endonuclease